MMDRRYLLLGCMLALGCVQAAAAGEFDARDTDANARRTTVDSATVRDGGSGGDAAGLSHDASPMAPAAGTSSSDADASHRGESDHAPHARHSSLGWQSLLPGSIQ